MTAVRLVLLHNRLAPKFEEWNRRIDWQHYENAIDMRETPFNLPVKLNYDDCYQPFSIDWWDQPFSIDFISVHKLGLSRCEEIVDEIFGVRDAVKILRVDWAVDVRDVTARTAAACCKVAGLQQHCEFETSCDQSVFYPYRTYERTISIKETISDPREDSTTRITIRLRKSGLPIQLFANIRGYGETDLLDGITFLPHHHLGKLPITLQLGAERLRDLVHHYGLHAVMGMFDVDEWYELAPWLHLEESKQNQELNLGQILRQSVRAWLQSQD